ncbi:hypothetical protein BDN70DRAFT_901287 [Pholiota conissans]|uniref:Uncharacterized protein n=1 Tax=Pholiota conissans TaxID=109636 RepID=A0A9P5YKI6_9AGAR|nr:hypothetical protein BDN70DRAFT_901287 [Pholiota conissans]
MQDKLPFQPTTQAPNQPTTTVIRLTVADASQNAAGDTAAAAAVHPGGASTVAPTTQPSLLAGNAVPGALVPGVVAAPSSVIAGATAAPIVAAGTDAGDVFDVDDPFICTDDAHPNFSRVCPPHPLDLVEPNNPSGTLYFVVTIGQPVGILTDLSNITLCLQQQFAHTRFTTWHGAFKFYEYSFERGEVRIIPINDFPDHHYSQHRVTSAAPSYTPVPPSAAAPGTAANPIYVGTPDHASTSQGSTRTMPTPTPAPRTKSRKGKGVFRTPVVYRNRAFPTGAETRIRRCPSTHVAVPAPVAQPAAPAVVPQPVAQPATAVSVVQPAATTVVPQPVAQPATAFSVAQQAATTVVSTQSATAVSVAQPVATAVVPQPIAQPVAATISQHATVEDDLPPRAPQTVVNVSDFEDDDLPPRAPQTVGPDFLPHYPKSTNPAVAPVTPASKRPAEAMSPRSAGSTSTTEIPPTAPSTPLPNQKPFKPLFTDSDDPYLNSPFVSNKRYKVTHLGRSLMIPGADPSSPVAGPSSISLKNTHNTYGFPLQLSRDQSYLTPQGITPCVSEANPSSSIAGPSSIPMDNILTAAPAPAPVNTNANVPSNANNINEQQDGADEYAYDSELDLDEVGRAMDQAWDSWQSSGGLSAGPPSSSSGGPSAGSSAN